jgi:hypothetical protein
MAQDYSSVFNAAANYSPRGSAPVTTRPSSIASFFTGGINPASYTRPSATPSTYKSQAAKDEWNNYMAAQAIQSSITPGALGYGSISRLPGEQWNDWMSRRSATENMFGGGLTGAGNLRSALRAEQGFSAGGSVRSRGGGISYGGGGGGMAGAGQGAPVEFYLGKPPELKPLSVDFGSFANLLQEANKPFIEAYQRATPGQEATLRSLSLAAEKMSTGQIPLDVARQSGRSAAALGFGTGLGLGRRSGGLERGLVARDLATTSLQLQQQAAQLAATIPQIMQAGYAAQFQFSPAQIADTAITQASINNQIANQQLLMNWMSQPLPGQFDVQRGQYIGFQPGTYSATRPTLPGTRSSNWMGSAYNPIG